MILPREGGGDALSGAVVAFLVGALAGVTAWLIFAEANRDMESLIRCFPSCTDDDRIEHKR